MLRVRRPTLPRSGTRHAGRTLIYRGHLLGCSHQNAQTRPTAAIEPPANRTLPALPAPSLLSTTTLNAAIATPITTTRTAYQFMSRMKAEIASPPQRGVCTAEPAVQATRRSYDARTPSQPRSTVGIVHIPLSDAVDRFKRETVAPSNAYSWYRKCATRDGTVPFGNHRIGAVKQGQRWMVDEADLEDALTIHRDQRAQVNRTTADYDSRILHPGIVEINGGGYRVKGDFHFLWNDIDVAHHRSDGFWRCNTCWARAATENNREECHRCRDWSPCGNDCTLSRIYCPTCGASEPM